MNRADVIRKIRACLALSASPEPAEAAAALRQAEKLMREHAVELADVHASETTQELAKSGFKTDPPAYAVILSGMVARAFQCDRIGMPGRTLTRTETSETYVPALWVFIGIAPRPELAVYAYEVLLRQLQSARRRYVRNLDKRCKPKTREARSEAFTVGWLNAVQQEVNRFAGRSEDDERAVLAFLRSHYPNLRTSKTELKASARHAAAVHDGLQAGRAAQLRHGLNEAPPRPALTGGSGS
ncbi:DUF2786 domain-containing protein [Plasticicumulans sp.]|uniref:DUF7168 domain-containing protein n=1 Tax=Plasticicumulans sp. TaxID=2307179 RepID=UPI002C461C00|nr:DUF2786 domain-containing protein [Plasticicumulans sp.]HMV37770.1 DUF2786 domain-containing protein [Plasticicumulans sp.]HNE02040.1 DUF2786 domain-containing protein [Plasticicumulans sp.]HNI23259.1 DUF2786 domain-containing protein [Plasticicumulans sp.]HNM43899.1 DUF2786 domain-containing protein [Plasticicumulans sp.]